MRSFVGLLPLLAVETLEPEMLERLPRFRRRLEWFFKYRPSLLANVASITETGAHAHYQLSILRLARIFLRDPQGQRPGFGGEQIFEADPHWRDHIPFYEYYHGATGAGVDASHQTGWTALVAKLMQDVTAR